MARGKPDKEKVKNGRNVVIYSKEQKKEVIESKGLLPKHVLFINAYFECDFNGSKAYKKVYDTKSAKTSEANASRLLSYDSVNNEVQSRFKSMGVTDNFIIGELKKVAEQPLNTETDTNKIQALKVLAQSKGMLTAVHKVDFSGDNPAVFAGLITKKEAKEFEELSRVEE